jgi:hypothetical protein
MGRMRADTAHHEEGGVLSEGLYHYRLARSKLGSEECLPQATKDHIYLNKLV